MNDLCIGGGGIDGLMFIGALEYLHENTIFFFRYDFKDQDDILFDILHTFI